MTEEATFKKALNLLQLKETMDEIVFNYIDTSQKWELAFSQLDELLINAIGYFESYVNVNGDLPKENTYWVLFLNYGYKLIYFHTISFYHLKGSEDEESKKRIIDILTLVANCIPNVKKRNHAEFLTEISNSLEEIKQDSATIGEFEKSILEQNSQVKDCIVAFSKVAQLLKNSK